MLGILYVGPTLLHPLATQIGSSVSEAQGHLWGLWVTAAGLFQHGPLVRVAPGVSFPDGFVSHLMDPVNLFLFLPGYWLAGGGAGGASLGWNLLHLGALLLGCWGAWRLARELDPEAGALALAVPVAVLGAGPFLWGHPIMGRTEVLPGALWPWHLALLLRSVRTGSWRDASGAGLLLGGMALGGGYIAVFTALCQVPLGLALLARSPHRAGQLLWAAGLGILVALPGVWAMLTWRPGEMSTSLLSQRPLEVDAAMRHLLHGKGLLGLLALVRVGERPDLAPFLEQPPYPGVVALSLGLAGVALRPRRTLPWILLAAWIGVLGLGYALPLGAEPRPGNLLVLPAGWFQRAFRPLGWIREWSRIGILLPVPVAMAAFLGVGALGTRWARAGGLLAVLGVLACAADTLTWPRHPLWPRPVFHLAQPAGMDQALAAVPDGALLQLPLEVSVGEGIKFEAATYLLWQAQHHRPISTAPTVVSETALRDSVLARLAVTRQFALSEEAKGEGRLSFPRVPPVERGLPGASGALSPEQVACLAVDAARLARQGYGALLIHPDRFMGPELEEMFSPFLGAPDGVGEGVRAWNLERLGQGADAALRCPPPPVPAKVRMMLRMDGG